MSIFHPFGLSSPQLNSKTFSHVILIIFTSCVHLTLAKAGFSSIKFLGDQLQGLKL